MAASIDSPNFLYNFWEMFGDDSNFVEVKCDNTTNLIDDILTTYGLQGDVTTALGGLLNNIDIKRMDALTVINLSLFEGSASAGAILEWTVNADGQFEVIKIGDVSGNDLSPIYYELQSGVYKESCVGVMLTGAKPLIKPKDLIWKYIWGDASNKYIYDTSAMVTNCSMSDFSTNAIIVYNDPHLDSNYEDGINNFYELTAQNPWEVIVGYARALSVPGYTDDQLKDTVIETHASSIIPIIVTGSSNIQSSADLGTLIVRPSAANDPLTSADDTCWSSQPGKSMGDYTKGVKIPLDPALFYTDVRGIKMSKFIRVESVYVVARKFDSIYSIPASPDAARQLPTANNSVLVGSINEVIPNTYRLEEGNHYTIVYDNASVGFKTPYILFAKNSRPNEPHPFGKGQTYYLQPACQLAQTSFGEGQHVGSILPIAENKGFLVEQVIAMVSLDTPSISVFDPEWNDTPGQPTKAKEIANSLEYKMAAIVIDEPPAPIAFCNGGSAEIVDQSATKIDSDPTSKQNFTDTPLEAIMDIMENGPGLSLTVSFIDDEDKLKALAETLYDHMTANGSSIETTYICGPEATPKLGAVGNNGGIINSINYSYTDSGSYTISVTEGPWLVGNLTSINTTASIKTTETVSARGTVIDSLGNNLFFKVRIDGYGSRVAINTAPNIIRKGDVVQCTIHNNPVEV